MSLYNNLKSVQENAEIEKANKKKESQYQNELSSYDEKKKEHDKKVAEYEKMVNTDGYLSRPVSQGLIFTHEPNANVSISGQSANYKASKLAFYDLNDETSSRLELKTDADNNVPAKNTVGNSYFIRADAGRTVKAVYNGLSNSSYNGRKISSVEYTFTPNKTENILISTDPTKTAWTFRNGETGELNTKMTVKFFYEDGSQVTFDKGSAILSLSSLNKYQQDGRPEYVDGFSNQEFIKITGSTVDYQGGRIIPTKSNSGGDYPNNESDWDRDGSPREYYGAAAVEINNKPTISFSFGTIGGGQWFKFNADVKAPTIPPLLEEPPTKPNLTPLKPIEKLPCKQPECYQGCHECCCDSIDLNNSMEDNLLKVDAKIDNMFNQICILKTANCSNRALLVSQYAYKMWCLLNDIMLLLAWLLIKKRSK